MNVNRMFILVVREYELAETSMSDFDIESKRFRMYG